MPNSWKTVWEGGQQTNAFSRTAIPVGIDLVDLVPELLSFAQTESVSRFPTRLDSAWYTRRRNFRFINRKFPSEPLDLGKNKKRRDKKCFINYKKEIYRAWLLSGWYNNLYLAVTSDRGSINEAPSKRLHPAASNPQRSPFNRPYFLTNKTS